MVVKPYRALEQLAVKENSIFKRIFLSVQNRAAFFPFLENIFHLYDAKEFQEVLVDNATALSTDREIYQQTQTDLKDIDHFYNTFTYALPSLWKQKEVMAEQAYDLLKGRNSYDGYLEVGSSGRYLDYLEEKIEITGNRYYSDVKAPGYGLQEMVERGQVFIGADYVAMNDYQTNFNASIPNNSLDLITVYIGFHHCPISLRETYIGDLVKLLRKDGVLILRDHDCTDDQITDIVNMAHDVFNLGTMESWEYNETELRNFYSLAYIQSFIEKMGLTYGGKSLYQEGDPTKNALMLFTKN